MLLGQILFVLAAISIVGATVIGVVFGVGKLVLYKLTGRALGPTPTVGSSEWAERQSEATVDLGRRSLLTERPECAYDEPVVGLGGDGYRVTRLPGGRFLVTEVAEGRRVGTFELAGEGRKQNVVPEADDPSNTKLLVQVAVLASHMRRSDNRVAPQ